MIVTDGMELIELMDNLANQMYGEYGYSTCDFQQKIDIMNEVANLINEAI